MRFFKNYKIAVLVAGLLGINGACATTVEIIENAYLLPAPPEIVELTEKAATLIGFDTPYEVAVPKKAGIQINPWNKFAPYNINPNTKNPLLVINPPWFLSLPAEEELFLLARNFMILKQGMLPLSVKMLPYIFMVISFLLLVLIFMLLRYTPLATHKKWIRFVVAWLITIPLNLFIMTPVQGKLMLYLANRYDTSINRLVVEKTGNKEAGIRAFEHYDAAIKNEAQSGETFWTPHINLFENLANELRK